MFRDELSMLRARINSLESQTKSSQQQSVRFAAPILNEPNNSYSQQPISRVSSLTSSSEYADACDEWPDEKAALIPTIRPVVEKPTKNAVRINKPFKRLNESFFDLHHH